MYIALNKSPVSYEKCNQTVTIYHKDGENYSQKVYSNAFLDFKKTQNVDKTGTEEASGFLFVIPTDVPVVFAGDKIYLGEGPQITNRQEWAQFIPDRIDGLVVVKYVDPKYWNGKMVHQEAGG